MGVRISARFANGGRMAMTAVLSSVLTTILMTAAQPEPAATTSDPVLVERALYPVKLPGEPSVAYDSHEAFLADYLALKRDLDNLRSAMDYDAAHGTLSPSLHEWADRTEPGAFGGGRQ